jgi:hopanoid biosynthesis associated radical SAM protein HpnJ
MSAGMKTLLLNPPSFENFDGGAGSRWPVSREIESYWYPVWLTYAAGMLEGSRLVDSSPQRVTPQMCVEMARDYEFLVLFTSTVGFEIDCNLVRRMKAVNPHLKVCFVGPHVQNEPVKSLKACREIDFVVCGEFDHAILEFAQGKPLAEILGIAYCDPSGHVRRTPPRPQLHTEELDALPFATDVYKRDLNIEQYTVPFLLYPYVSLYTTRGCPALCTFCQWPQTISGHAWRTRSVDNVVREVRQALGYWPQLKEFFWDDDTFNIRKDRVLALCEKFKPLKFRWSCNARVHSDYETLKAMAEAGARLFIVGFESGDDQILKNIKKGTTTDHAREFVKNCKKVGITIHGDFIIGLPGETKETIEKTIDFAKELDCETVQVSMAHAFPGTELYNYAAENGFLRSEALTDSIGHQLPHLEYPGLSREEMMDGVQRFYDRYYFRPRVIWRIVKKALWDSHERKRLIAEGAEFLRTRREWKQKVKQGLGTPRPVVPVPDISTSASD